MTMRSWIRAAINRPVTRPIRRQPRARLGFEGLEDRTVPSTFTVLNTLDDGSIGSLRWAIAQANTNGGADTIDFDGTVFNSPQSITLGGTQLELSDTTGATTITGPAVGVTINANNASRVFKVNVFVTGSLSDLTITGGNASNGGGVLNRGTLAMINCTVSGNSANYTSTTTNYIQGTGGGVFNRYSVARLEMTNCTISGNSASSGGGGLHNDLRATVTLTNCTVSDNSAGSYLNGGGLLNTTYGMATLTNCTVSGNSAYKGGGLYNERATVTLNNCTISGNSASEGGGLTGFGTATLTNCTVSGNSASRGGGLSIISSATLSNCTVSGNSASVGGGLYVVGAARLTNCTVSGNSARVGGGLFNYREATLTNCTVSGNSASEGGGGLFNGETSALTNTILAGNAGGDIWNFYGSVYGTNNLIGGDPLLAPLGDYGGPTQTMALLPGSPALGAGTATGAPSTDQRGSARVGAVDIGAFERQAPTIAVAGPQTAYEDVDKAIGGISIGDTASATLTITLGVSHGKLTLGTTTGLTVNGAGTGTVTLTGTTANLNAALATLVYRGALNYSGADTLRVTATDGSLSAAPATVAINVVSAADQAAALRAQVTALRNIGVLNKGQANMLISDLNLKGTSGDIAKVQQFLVDVTSLLTAGVLTPAQADALLGPGNILLLGVTRR